MKSTSAWMAQTVGARMLYLVNVQLDKESNANNAVSCYGL